MAMLEHIAEAQEALQEAAGVKVVGMNVNNMTMTLSALDDKVKGMDEKGKKKTAKVLAATALEHWTDKWPITEVQVLLAYEGGSRDVFKFKPSELESVKLEKSETPAPAETEETPVPSEAH